MKGLILLCLLLCGGCIELPDFPKASIVVSPRILAIVAEPPEVTPGAPIDMSMLVVDVDPYDVSWKVCGTFDMLFSGQQFGEMEEDDCSESTALWVASGRSVSVSGALLDAAWNDPRLNELILGGALSPEVVQKIRSSVGLPLLVEATVTTGEGRTLRAVKRLLISENPTPNHNPPPPEFSFGGSALHADGQTPWSCSPVDTSFLSVPPNTDSEIVPATVDGEESWVEPYRIITAQGELMDRTERAFYSWFATGGSFDQRLTRAPLRNQVWTSPKQPGCYRLWLVVRDGHGGESACGWDVGVGDESDWPAKLQCAPP